MSTFPVRPTTQGVVPAPGASPPGADVQTVDPGDLIDAAWGTAVAADLAELWARSLAGMPAGGTTGQVISKTSAVDYAAGWATLTKTDVGLGSVDNTTDVAKPISTATQSALDAKAPIRRTVKADTTTAYAPILTDENQMVTLSNAAAITVTLPQNSVVAFPVGAEVDFLWLGVGQPTFAAGSGATVNGTPGLKLRAQYSAATLKKISTNGWIAIGDLA